MSEQRTQTGLRSRRRRPPWQAAVWLASLAAVLIPLLPACAQESLATDVKATYLYKLAPFIDWPTGAFAGPQSPFAICVVGKDPFGSVLDRATAGQQVAGHLIVVRRMATADRSAGCQIVYLGGGAHVKEALLAVHGAPVLTVTDQANPPGVVDFAIDRGRVQFRIDEQAAAENGLTVSSKLLSLALSVKPRRAGS